MMRMLAALVCLLPVAVAVADAPPAAAYRLERSIALGPGERWDYVTFDGAAQRAYVAHGDHVSVVDLAQGKTIGSIGPLPGGTHGIAIVPAAGAGFTDDGRAGIAAAFDPVTFKIMRRIPAAADADGIAFDRASGHVFVINGDSGSITVIDPAKRAAIATIKVGSGLEAAVADGHGSLFVDGVAQHDLVVIDTRTNQVRTHYPMPGCERPHGIALDPATARVFATCINKVAVILDGGDGRLVATVPIGMGSDGAAFDPRRKRFLSSNGEGTLSVIEERDADHFVPQPDVPTQKGARTIAIDADSGRVFLPTAQVTSVEPATTPGGRPRVTYRPGSLALLVYAPTR